MRRGSQDQGPALWDAREYRVSYQEYIGSAIYHISAISICIVAA